MLIDAERSYLLLIDLQERLAPAINDMQAVLASNLWLIDIAKRLDVPALATVHYPAGLGPALPEVIQRIGTESIVEKIYFSAAAEPGLTGLPVFSRPQVIVTGTEAHICVLQTAIGLRALGKDVFVVADAVGSRRESDRQLALERLRQEGCRIVSRDMVAYEWLGRAGTELFRDVHRRFLR